MASSYKPQIQLFKCDAALTKYIFAKFGTDDSHVNKCTAGTDKHIGIVQSTTTAAEDLVEVALGGAGAKLTLGGTVTRGDRLTADSSGKGVTTTSTSDQIGAVAMASGVASDVIPVQVVVGSVI